MSIPAPLQTRYATGVPSDEEQSYNVQKRDQSDVYCWWDRQHIKGVLSVLVQPPHCWRSKGPESEIRKVRAFVRRHVESQRDKSAFE